MNNQRDTASFSKEDRVPQVGNIWGLHIAYLKIKIHRTKRSGLGLQSNLKVTARIRVWNTL